jgi:hypothetical protein
MIFGALICRFRGHKWRRLRKNESAPIIYQAHRTLVRICRCCDLAKLGKARTVKARAI